METNNNQVSVPASQAGAVDYAAALRQYNKYGRGRSMKKFCEDEGYDYWKFCKLAYMTIAVLKEQNAKKLSMR